MSNIRIPDTIENSPNSYLPQTELKFESECQVRGCELSRRRQVTSRGFASPLQDHPDKPSGVTCCLPKPIMSEKARSRTHLVDSWSCYPGKFEIKIKVILLKVSALTASTLFSHSAWSKVHEARCMKQGAWSKVHGARCMEQGAWSKVMTSLLGPSA